MPEQRQIPTLAVIGLILAVLMSPVGLIVSIIAWQRIRKNSLRGKGLAIAGIAIGTILTLIPLIAFVWLNFMLGGFRVNEAEKEFKPIGRQITEIDGVKICDSGSNGHGIDDITPWYHVYYAVPDSPGLTDKVKSIAAQAGYQLKEKTEAVNPPVAETSTTPTNSQTSDPGLNRFAVRNGNESLEVTFNSKASAILHCGSTRIYENRQPDGGSQIVIDFLLTLPPKY